MFGKLGMTQTGEKGEFHGLALFRRQACKSFGDSGGCLAEHLLALRESVQEILQGICVATPTQ